MGQAAAQQDQEKEQEKEKIRNLPEVTVTGTSMATDLQTHPGSVLVISRKIASSSCKTACGAR